MSETGRTGRSYIPALDWMRTFAILAVVMIHCLPGEDAAISGTDAYFVQLIHGCCNAAVPIFVMLTGAIMLDREESLRKNGQRVVRLVLALLVFGGAAAFLEEYFHSRALPASIVQAGLRLLSGDSWSFCWFLYMMIGVYLLLPLFQIFAKNAGDSAFLYTMAVLFVFVSVLPGINDASGRTVLDFYLPVDSIYALYLLLGYYMQHRRKRDLPISLCVSGIVLCAAAFALFLTGKSIAEFESMSWLIGYASPVVVILACSVFQLMKRIDRAARVVRLIAQNAFGIYLLHCFYIHIAHYLLGVPESLPITPLLFLCVFPLSLASAWLLRKIRVVRQYLM